MTTPHGGLERAVAGLTVGTVTAERDRARKAFHIEATQMTQCLQCPIAGLAGDTTIFSTSTIMWHHPFVTAPGQHDSELDTPHFGYGLEFADNPKYHIHIDIHVVGWVKSVEGYFTGARIRVAARVEGAPKKLRFSAIAHLSFSGYGAPSEDIAADAQ